MLLDFEPWIVGEEGKQEAHTEPFYVLSTALSTVTESFLCVHHCVEYFRSQKAAKGRGSLVQRAQMLPDMKERLPHGAWAGDSTSRVKE